MTREEAREELIEEWNEFIDGCGLRGIEEKEVKRNPDFKKVYEANLMAIQALEQEPSGDLISRQAVIERLKKEDKILYTTTGLNYLIRAIEELPPVKLQEPKTGYWFVDERPESNREVICSNCEQPVFKYHKLGFDYRPKYCPNCGARMQAESEE